MQSLIFTVVLLAVQNFAQSRTFTDVIYTRFTESQEENVKSAQTFSLYGADLNTPTTQSCTKFFAPLSDKQKIRIDYFIGYADDYKDMVRDRSEFMALRALLLSPCFDPKHNQLCGFQKPLATEDLYTKDVRWYDGKIKKIELYLKNASISESDRFNRSSPEQTAKSTLVRNQFIQAMSQTDLLIYSGHSRFGGGPDFSPVVYKDHANYKEDVDYYVKNKRGLSDMLQGLGARSTKPWLIFLGSCDSKKHFSKSLSTAKNAPHATLLSADITSELQSHITTIRILDTLTNQRCPTDPKAHYQGYELVIN